MTKNGVIPNYSDYQHALAVKESAADAGETAYAAMADRVIAAHIGRFRTTLECLAAVKEAYEEVVESQQ
jgi:hypothetical protein